MFFILGMFDVIFLPVMKLKLYIIQLDFLLYDFQDVIATQEQYISLQSEFLRYKKDTSDQIVAIKVSVGFLNLHSTIEWLI